MPRPRKPIRPVGIKVYLPEDLAAELEILLFSPLENRVPHGKKSEWITAAIRAALDRLKHRSI